MCRRLRHPAARDIHAGWHERLSLAVPFGPEEPAARPAPQLASPDAARPLHTLQELAVVQMVRLAGPLAVLALLPSASADPAPPSVEPAARPAPQLRSPDAVRPLHTVQELAVVQMVRLAGRSAVLDSNLFADGAIPDKMWQALCGSDLGQGNYGAGIIHKRASR